MENAPPFLTRFAPSPTGYLHLGHACSALHIWKAAEQNPDHFILRIEDIDPTRCKPEFETAIYEDLAWLGISWSQKPRCQSEHMADYKQTLEVLSALGVIYPCFCTRKDILDEIANSPSAPHGLNSPLYPGTCKHFSLSERADKIDRQIPYALRLDMAKAVNHLKGQKLYWTDTEKGEQETTQEILVNRIGDVVLARKDTPASYHLCVTHDDHHQGISRIIRGEDLFFATHIHRLIQQLCNYTVPTYTHHHW